MHRVPYVFRYVRDDQIISTSHVAISTDEKAIQIAKEMRFSYQIEVWRDGALIFTTSGQNAHDASSSGGST